MKRFRNILVGIDLCSGDRFVGDSLSPQTTQAVNQALWLAKVEGAKITFVYALDISERTLELIRESGEEATVLDEARQALAALVQQATDHGVQAAFDVLIGKSWVEVIRRVLTQGHDLVIVGTRNLSVLPRVLFGSTGIKLLRKCPCPVWVTKPSDRPRVASVLVAHDMTPVGTLALELGASLAELQHAALHVLHSVEHPEYDHAFPSRIPAQAAARRRAAAQAQIDAELAGYTFTHLPQITITDAEPAPTILGYIEAHHIELLAMGTIARTGISGVITGNTAERLLPSVPCSILAVKPSDFVSPVEAIRRA